MPNPADLKPHRQYPAAVRYGVAALLAVAAVALRIASAEFVSLKLVYIFFYPACMLAGAIGGFGPGLFCLAICAAATCYFFLPPPRSWRVESASDLVGLFTFIVVVLLMLLIIRSQKRATARARRYAAMIKAERERLQVTLASIGDAVIVASPEATVDYLNAVAEELTGWKNSEALGKPLHEVFPIFSEVTGKPAENPVDKVLRTGMIVGLANHTELRRRDGKRISIDDSAAPIRSLGQIVGVIMVFRDVTTARRNQEQQLLQSRVLESMAEGVLVTGEDNLIIYTNSAQERIFGYGPGEMIGLHVSSLNAYSPRENARMIEESMQSLKTAGMWRGEFHNRRKDGTLFYTFAHITRLTSDDTKYYVCVQQDITERKLADEKLAKAYAELEQARDAALQASKAKSQFLATMSHELRTPLNAILGYAELLKEELQEKGEPRMVADLDRVLLSGNHLLAVIGDILDLSRIEAGKLHLQMEQLHAEEIVREAVQLALPLIEGSGNVLEMNHNGACDKVHADRVRLRQVLFNLLANAAKFTDNGRVRVTIQHDPGKPDRLEIAIEDTGVGITSEQMGRLFQPFEQLDPSPTRQHGGAGLGLAISQRLMHLMQGDIRVKSDPGRGSTFSVSLPCVADGNHS